MWTRLALVIALGVFAIPSNAASPMTKLQVEVTNHEDNPVDRASVILRFVETERSIKTLGKKKVRQWETRTNQDGIAKFPSFPQGEVRLLVIAERYQTFGEDLEINEEEKTIQVKLNPPQQQYSAH